MKDEAASQGEKPGALYLRAIESIPLKSRDDGVFGLGTNYIGNNSFVVNGNTLVATNLDDGSVQSFEIDDYDLWRLLLVKRPRDIELNLNDRAGQQVLHDYIEIVGRLDLIRNAVALGVPYKTRAKFKILPKAMRKITGSGFLFTTRKPPIPFPISKKKRHHRLFHPSTVVIPSDKKGLLRALLQAVTELRAGNTSMQNLVVPLAKEAKRKKILPNNLLSPDEMTWVFA